MNTAATLETITDAERQRRAREQRTAAVARERFTYIDRSVGPITIERGEIVAMEHEVVAGHPEKFEMPNRNRGRGSRPELNSPAPVKAKDDALPRPRWILGPGPGLVAAGTADLRTSKSPITVYINARARNDITEHAEAVPYGYETGGLLIARRSHDRANVRLVDAWGPSVAAIRKRNALALDWEADHARAADRSRMTERYEIVAGVWHVHPEGSAKPSEADLRMFAAAMADASERVWPIHTYVGLIATSVGRSAGPDLTAWVLRRSGLCDDLICERAEIKS